MDSATLQENGHDKTPPPDTTMSSPGSTLSEKTSESEQGGSSSSSPANSLDSHSHDEPQPKDKATGETTANNTYSTLTGTTPTQTLSTSPSTPRQPMSGGGCYRGSPRSSIQPLMPPCGTEETKGTENISLSNYMMLMSLQKQQQQQQALHGGGSYQMLQPGMQLSPINPPTTLPPEYGAFPRVVTPHSHSQSPNSHPPQPPVVSSYSTHLSNKLSDHGIGTGYPVFSPQQTQGLLTMEPPNHGQYSPLRNQPMISYGVGGGAHMQQKQTTLMQMPQVQLPLKAEGVGDSEAKAIQKGRKRPLSHSGSASSTDNLALSPGFDPLPPVSDHLQYSKTLPYQSLEARKTHEQDPSGYHLIREKMFPLGTDGLQVLDSGGGSGQSQRLKWQAHMVNSWHEVCDGALQDIQQIGFQVEADKGFNFSTVDDSFVCQKKNHFQVTVQILFRRTPKFLKMKDGSIQPISMFTLHLHGVKFEQINSMIALEQSLTDRTKKKFNPVMIDVPAKPDEPLKTTICRLHFSETTANNMRKRGKPNPEQKHFSLVVALHADTAQGSFPVVSHVSERIIVRASNPGNFDSDCDYCWLRASNPEVTYHHGRVGINTDKPDEALTVNGNIQLTGQILQASDIRVKQNIRQVDCTDHLDHIAKLQLYEYQFDKGLSASGSGMVGQQPVRRHVGLLAQEVKEVIPDAVKETCTEVCLADGSTVSGLLVVDKDRVLMETVGAVQELKQIVDQLTKKVDALEKGSRVSALHQQQCSSCTRQSKIHLNKGNGSWFLLAVFSICIIVFLISLLYLMLQSSSRTLTAVSIHDNSSRTFPFEKIFKF